MTKNGYVLSNWHKKCLKAFADKHGVDAMIDVVVEFEKTGSLGRAMVNVKSKMTKVLVSDVVSGNAKNLGLPVYVQKPYVILSVDGVVLWAGDIEKMIEDSSLWGNYYDDLEVVPRSYDMHMTDNTKINC